MSVPITSPLDASLAISFIPFADTNTPAQKTITMIAPVQMPFDARSGLIT